MALKGLKLNMPYFLLHSLHMMAVTVQRTTSNHDRGLFHHGLIKMMVQYHLATVGRTWDDFLKDNGFGLTKFYPILLPKTHSK